ncbi:NAD-dependent epimerase, partial [Azospirillum brasilense]|nr:NAD-dependent epimerase [Azospirillum brasilense]
MGITLVTGGSGFIGGGLVTALAGRGERLRLFGRREPPGVVARGVGCHRGPVPAW